MLSVRTLRAVLLACVIVTAPLAATISLSVSIPVSPQGEGIAAAQQKQYSSPQLQVDIDPSDLPGDGTESDPYQISNVSELQAMEDDLDANYELVSDIDASQTAEFNNGSGFDPVGNEANDFSGSLDGDGRTITGLTIDRPGEDDVGLFGETAVGASIANLSLRNLTLTGNNTVGGLVGDNTGSIQNATAIASVNGSNNVGGLVGLNNGTITDATVSQDVIGSDFATGGLVGDNTKAGDITTARVSGSVTGGDFATGGLAGENDGNITNATVTANVAGSGEVGGVVGDHDAGTIQGATASGSVNGTDNVGGLVGDNDGIITDARAEGSVNGTDNVGGLVGDTNGAVESVRAVGNVIGGEDVGGLVGDTDEGAIVTNATASGSVTGTNNVGGVVGDHDAGTIQNATSSGSVNGSLDVGGLVGSNEGIITASTGAGKVTGGDKVGGLVGSNSGGQINVSVATGSVIVQSSQTNFTRAGGLVGGNFRGGVVNQSYAKTAVNGGDNEGRSGALSGRISIRAGQIQVELSTHMHQDPSVAPIKLRWADSLGETSERVVSMTHTGIRKQPDRVHLMATQLV